MRAIPVRRAAGVLALVLALAILAPPAAAQEGVATGTITVTGVGQASAPADTATVFLTVSTEGMPMPLPVTDGSSAGEVAPVVDALAEAGVDEGSMSVITGPGVATAASYYGPAIAIIRFDLQDPTAAAINAAVDAATVAAMDARLFIGGLGVRLASDQCAALAREAVEAAIADARARAVVMGELTGLLPGETLAVREVPSGSEAAGTTPDPLTAGCAPLGMPPIGWEMYGPSIYDPTQEPVVRVSAHVEMTFAASPSILATPSG